MATHDPGERMTAIALSFPSVARLVEQGTLNGVAPWSFVQLQDSIEAHSLRPLGSGAHGALAFLVSLWSGESFNLRRAWGRWDSEHRAAWLAWAADPWWP